MVRTLLRRELVPQITTYMVSAPRPHVLRRDDRRKGTDEDTWVSHALAGPLGACELLHTKFTRRSAILVISRGLKAKVDQLSFTLVATPFSHLHLFAAFQYFSQLVTTF